MDKAVHASGPGSEEETFCPNISLRKVVKQTSGQTTKRFINGGIWLHSGVGDFCHNCKTHA